MKKKNILVWLLIIFFTGLIQINGQRKNAKQALLIIDIQNDYFEGGANPLSGSLEASLNAKKILNKFRQDSLPVIHIKHLSLRSGSTFFIPNTKGAEIHENVAPLAQEKVIIKNYPNSFINTELLEYLKAQNITDLVICGMMTHMCIDATVRAAKDYNFNCTIISDACATKDLSVDGATVTSNNVQTAFLAALSYYYSSIENTQEFLSKIKTY